MNLSSFSMTFQHPDGEGSYGYQAKKEIDRVKKNIGDLLAENKSLKKSNKLLLQIRQMEGDDIKMLYQLLYHEEKLLDLKNPYEKV